MSPGTILISLLIFLNLGSVCAQDENYQEPDTSSAYSGFASVFFMPGTIASQNVLYLGGLGSVLVNDKIIIGGYGMRKTGTMYADKGALTGKMISFGSAGLAGGYTFTITEKIKPVIQCMVGWGGLTFSSTDSKGYAITESFSRLGVVSPSLSVDFNVFWYLWLSAGVNYMYVGGVSADGYSSKDFSKPGGYFSIKLMTR